MNKIKVLIVEDEVILAKDIEKTIFELGFEVTGFVTCVDNVFISIETNKPDIILMDINLNDDLDGIEVVHKIYETQFIPVIYLTSSYDDDIIKKAVKTNPIGYLLKPFRKYELKSTIMLAIYKNKKLDDISRNLKY